MNSNTTSRLGDTSLIYLLALAAGLAVAGSFGPMQDNVFRLGHMGAQADMGLLRQALGILEKHLPR